jgi:phage major capsid protein, P2 family
MRNNTKLLYAAMQVAMAESYGAPGGIVTENFAVEIPMETKLNSSITQSSEFLQRITVEGVTDMKGQALRLGITGIMAGRTTGTRAAKMLGSPTGTTWEAVQTNFDVGIDYNTMDSWARLGNLMDKYAPVIYNAIALDRITVGIYGTSVATTTDPVTNPLGQDVNLGWGHLLKTQKPANYMLQGTNLANQIQIGETGDYKNIDAMAKDLLNQIPVEHRTGKEVVIVGSALVAADSNKVLSTHGQTPSEKPDIKMMSESYGGLPAMQIPKFPDMGMWVTDPKNLHLYYQEDKTRRSSKDESALSMVVDYISSNDAYAIGNLEAFMAVEAANVVFV